MKLPVGIVGFRGYSGAELVRILERHGHVQPVLLEHREDHGHAASIRHAKEPVRLVCDPETVRAEGLVLVFLATPPEVSMGLAPILVQEIFRTLVEINRSGVTLLLVEQNARQALQIATRGYVLETGHLVLSGSGAELMNHPRVKEAYLGG